MTILFKEMLRHNGDIYHVAKLKSTAHHYLLVILKNLNRLLPLPKSVFLPNWNCIFSCTPNTYRWLKM